MKTFNDFLADASPKLSDAIDSSKEEAKDMDNGVEAMSHLIADFVMNLLKEYHEWLVSEILPQYQQSSSDQSEPED